MGIWLLGIENHSAQSADIFYGYKGAAASSATPPEFDRSLPPGEILECDTVTEGQSDAFGVTMHVNGRRYDFNIWDDNWKLCVKSHTDNKSQFLDILHNYGQYKIFIEDSGLTIEDISKGTLKLGWKGVSKRYYHMFTGTDPVPAWGRRPGQTKKG